MKIKLWGVRGSLPVPGPHTVKYGGNTACIELRIGERLIIIDAGSGIRELGDFIIAHELPKKPIKVDLFLTHTHLDHIIGFPFFAPIYLPGTFLNIYGPVTYEDNYLEEVINGQFTYRYFPVRWSELSARMNLLYLREEQRDLGGGLSLSTKYLNHPVLCLGYRFEYHGKVFCTLYDSEPFRNPFSSDPSDPAYERGMTLEGEETAYQENQRVENFVYGADLLIHDGQYTQDEYLSSKIGWGHSSCEHAIDVARRNAVKKIVLFHHDPLRRDDEIDILEEKYARTANIGSTEILFAREGMELDI
ncbi:MAG: MBL fold metallo-hydrolase [Deltaproteobacteria bacterium]|nr:MBL fold metallo-hydrolase [Deltaproteobacteria bacterium]